MLKAPAIVDRNWLICPVGIALTGLLFLLSACACLSGSSSDMNHFLPLQTESANPRAGIILIPGLNLRPEALHEIANQFISRGLRARIVSLRKPAYFERISGQQLARNWTDQVRQDYQELRRQMPDRPVLIFGYSLGALLALNLILEEPENSAAVFLVAPPLKLHTLPSLLLSAISLLPASFPIISVARERYRIESWTAAAEYHALTLLQDQLRARLPLFLKKELSGSVFFSSRDELVSDNEGAEDFVRYLPKLEVHVLRSKGNSHGHLMLDQYSLGVKGWQEFSDSIAAAAKLVGTQQTDTPAL
jgi:pimeloyl-ACP methyl ester carboxylesterase